MFVLLHDDIPLFTPIRFNKELNGIFFKKSTSSVSEEFEDPLQFGCALEVKQFK